METSQEAVANRTRTSSALAAVVLAALLLLRTLHAQITFQRTYGGSKDDLGQTVQQTTDGGYIMAGTTLSYGTASYGTATCNAYVIKTNPHGDTEWTRSYATGGVFSSARQTDDGGFILAVTVAVPYGSRLIKLTPHGEEQWVRICGSPMTTVCVEQTADGGFVLAGRAHGDACLLKTDAQGHTVWAKTYGGDSSDCANGVRQTSDGGFIIVGTTESFGPGYASLYLVKTDALGDTLWTKAYGRQYCYDEGYSVAETADGGFVVAGTKRTRNGHQDDAYLGRTDDEGDTLWTRTSGGGDYECALSVRLTTDGGYITAGQQQGSRNSLYLVKWNSKGAVQWTRTFGGRTWELGSEVEQTLDGGYIIVGESQSYSAGRLDVYLVKTDSAGRVAGSRSPTLLLSCSPNPASGATTLHLSPIASGSSPAALRIFDASGRLALERSVSTSPLTLAVSSLPPGVYLARVTKGFRSGTLKLIVQR